jgi:hypothetical protein
LPSRHTTGTQLPRGGEAAFQGISHFFLDSPPTLPDRESSGWETVTEAPVNGLSAHEQLKDQLLGPVTTVALNPGAKLAPVHDMLCGPEVVP